MKHIQLINNVIATSDGNVFEGCGIDWCSTMDSVNVQYENTMRFGYCMLNDYCKVQDMSNCGFSFDMCLCYDFKAGGGDTLNCDGVSGGSSDIISDNNPSCRSNVMDASFCNTSTFADDVIAE